MNSLDRLAANVGDNTSIASSLANLLGNIAGEINVSAGNEAASRSLATMIVGNADHLARLVMAGTPMILATPPVHPAPGFAGGGADRLDVTSMTGTTEEIAKWQGDNDKLDHGKLREVERIEHPDGTVTVYFRPVPDKDDADAHAKFEAAAAKRKADDEAKRKAAAV